MEHSQIILFAIFAVGIGVVFLSQYRLKKYISREKILASDDITVLWSGSLPPKAALTDAGLRLRRRLKACILLLSVCLLIIYVDSAQPYLEQLFLEYQLQP